MDKKIELLCPAGNIESFKAACQNGADAIYMGLGKFNARTMAKNFDTKSYIECIEYAHLRDVKVYLTLNTLLFDNEIKEALELLELLYKNGLDAVILQDIGLASLVHKAFPDLHMHASTQMSIYSLEQVKFMKKLGFSRVVLARELTISEIENICKNTDLEIEVFVHGALCVSVSGQCLLSASIGDRSANRGSCAQPCRMKYSLYNSKGKQLEKETYLLSKKDIFGFDLIGKLQKAGVTSLKIEGRNKTPEYVASVTSSYRRKIDKEVLDEEIMKKELQQMYNRNGVSTGYLEKVQFKDSITLTSPKNTGLFLGKVLEKRKNFVKLNLREDISLHDGFEIYSEKGTVSSIVTCIKDERGNIINKDTKKGSYVWIGDISKSVNIGDNIYKTSSDNLNRRYRKSYEGEKRKKDIIVNISIKAKKKIYIEYINNKITHKLTYDYIPDNAINRAISIEDIKNAFAKNNDIPFNFEIKDYNIDDGLFIPVAKLNDIRRYICEDIVTKNKIVNKIDIDYEKLLKLPNELKVKGTSKKSLCIYRYNTSKNYNEQMYDIIEIQVQDYIKYSKDILKRFCKNDIYIIIPNFTLEKVDKYIYDNLEEMLKSGIKGFVISNFKFYKNIICLKEKYNFRLIADYGFNISNVYSVLFLKELEFDEIVPAFDIPNENIENMSKYINICISNDYVVVMTSRYCILGSFIANRKDLNNNCSMPCTKDSYYLKDSFGYNREIVCDNIDCVMRILKKIKNIDIEEYNISNIGYIRSTTIG